jgi:predicted Zn-dependent peptidase
MFEKSVLDNGLRVLSAPMPQALSVTVAILLGAGSRHEDDASAGVSHLLEHMCFKGTTRRPTPMEISETIEGVGGLMNASTDYESTRYWCKVARAHLHTAVELLADMVQNSRILVDELEKERQVVLEELAMSNDVPSARVDALISRVMWPDQPLGRDIGGTKESVQLLQRNTLLDYWNQQYTPNNAVLVVAGNVSHDDVIDLAQKNFGDWKPLANRDLVPAQDNQSDPRFEVEYWRSDQAHICLGIKGISSSSPDRYKLGMLNTILGEGMSSRLFVELRERQGLAYEVQSSLMHLKDCGEMIVYAGVAPKNAEKAISGILQELSRLRDDVPVDTLEKSRGLSKGRTLLRMEDTRSVAGWVGGQELLLGEVLTVDEAMRRVDEVTPSDVQEMAQKLFVDSKLNLAVVGPFRGDRAQKRLGNLLKL